MLILTMNQQRVEKQVSKSICGLEACFVHLKVNCFKETNPVFIMWNQLLERSSFILMLKVFFSFSGCFINQY